MLFRSTGQRFGATYVIDVLLGKADDRIGRNGHDRLSVFGIGRDTPVAEWKTLFRQLTAAGHLTGDGEGFGGLVMTDLARPLLRGEEKFLTRKAPATPSRSRRDKEKRPTAGGADEALFQALRALRQEFATQAKVPPYYPLYQEDMPIQKVQHSLCFGGEKK